MCIRDRDLRLSCIRFCVYQDLRLSCIRFCVYRVNRNTSAFSWTMKRKTQKSPTLYYYCRVIKYCWFLFAVTICFCFLKLKNYQYYYNFNLINSIWLHCCFLLRLHICWSRKKYVWIEIPADKNYCMFWCADRPRNQNIYRCNILINANVLFNSLFRLSLIHIWRCRRYAVCRSRWSPDH